MDISAIILVSHELQIKFGGGDTGIGFDNY
jgi:hypothetical protein